ncbi:MAG: hypothetical protein PHS30_00970 [Bacteroidales bacterium]|nr:hypothetical protein [Bacteroidales bacterium]
MGNIVFLIYYVSKFSVLLEIQSIETMSQHSTPVLLPQKKLRREYAQPSASTLDFLKNFARTYSPIQEHLNEKVNLAVH